MRAEFAAEREVLMQMIKDGKLGESEYQARLGKIGTSTSQGSDVDNVADHSCWQCL